MRIELGTPGLLFGAISLLLLGYTSRFLAIAALIRNLHDRYQGARDAVVFAQITQLRRRLRLIQSMQTLGVAAFLLCLGVLAALLVEVPGVARGLFVATLVLLAGSLVLALVEIRLSVGALALQLADLEHPDAPAAYPRVNPETPRTL